MVDLETVKKSNSTLRSNTKNPVAVFAGATSGVGETTAKSLVRHTDKPTVFLLGRNEAEATRIIGEMKEINKDGKYTFIKSDLTLMKNVDDVCNDIKSKTDTLDILFMSQGQFSFSGRDDTVEGLDKMFALRYYSRLRLAQNLLPLLSKSQNTPRIVSCLGGGGMERPIVEDDLDLKTHYNIYNSMMQPATMNTLAFDVLSKDYPGVGFVHTFPWIVKTNLFTSGLSAPVAWFMGNIIRPLMTPIAVSVEETGERMLFHATAPRYARGNFSVNWKGEVPDAPKFLKEYRQRGVAQKVWTHTLDMYKNALDPASS